ncbi:hypothetical protein J2M53_16315 [Arthrobacter sp. zg-ZUI100]|uniref:Uncharacterized protein n=1 Tax=Arthrobacter jiangjiafuii TaxID=2817475 RepID=A0A975M6L0_9MICC|nr:hypothetical protein [Arthrobacter jiangjiafuii]MBP3037805.1 hypothetical protein [Arthrobacter jiangjiafuii]MBP3045082.1 hypothetical protein [Arthrobacter jiangjiafuii]QWC10599.1 hypothetical protein KKR91_02860 [Arthrobacter jiangjiafuii]
MDTSTPPQGRTPNRTSPSGSPLRRSVTGAAALLAVLGLLSLGAVLLSALRGESVWPGFAAGAIYLLPVAFVLMAGLVIDGIRRRRRG